MGFPGPLSDWQQTLDWIQCCSGTDPPAPHSQVSCYLSQIHMPVLLGDATYSRIGVQEWPMLGYLGIIQTVIQNIRTLQLHHRS